MGIRILFCVFLSFSFLGTEAQLRPLFANGDNFKSAVSTENNLAIYTSSHSKITTRHKFASPRLMQSMPTAGDRRSTNYWTNAVTMQSYGKGKWGTFYYWDVQGNLREMKGFLDIAGKNKRGLKLVFPWR